MRSVLIRRKWQQPRTKPTKPAAMLPNLAARKTPSRNPAARRPRRREPTASRRNSSKCSRAAMAPRSTRSSRSSNGRRTPCAAPSPGPSRRSSGWTSSPRRSKAAAASTASQPEPHSAWRRRLQPPAALCRSSSQPRLLLGIEGATVAGKRRCTCCMPLPALDDNVAIARVDFEREANAANRVGSNQGRARSGEGFVDPITFGAVVHDRPAHALDGLLRPVFGGLVVFAGGDGPQSGLIARALPVAGGSLSHRVEARFVLPVIVTATEHQAWLRPYDLCPDQETARIEALRNRPRMDPGVPHISDFAGEQAPSLAPIGTVVVADLARTRRRGDARLVSPVRIIVDTIGWIGHHEVRTCTVEYALDIGRNRRIAAQQAVLSQQPKITWSGDRLSRQGGDFVLFLRCSARIEAVKQAVELVLGKPEQIESDVILLESLELGRQHLFVPAGVQRDAVVGEPEGPRLRIRQMPEPNDRHFPQPEALGSYNAAVACDQHAAVVDQARHVEAELRDRAGNLGDLLVGMSSGVGRIRQEPLDRPKLDLQRVTRRPGLRLRAPERPLRSFGLRHRVSLVGRERACANGGVRRRRIRVRARLPWRAGRRVPQR